jgi:hypothetical protein
MQISSRFTRILHTTKRTKLLVAAVLAVVASSTGLGVHKAQAAMITDCSANSIISCGVTSAADLITKIKANQQGDLPAIYASFGLKPEDYDAFAKEAKMGMATRGGEIIVDGQKVATSTWSIGRSAKSYSTPVSVNGKTYHKSASTDVMMQDLPVYVWFDANGKVKAAVIAACGNPMNGTGVTPSYKCEQLRSTPVKDQANTYQFNASAPVAGNATISRVVYDFGDGTPQVTMTNPSDIVTHTFTGTGSFNAKVTVYVKLPGGQEVSVSGTGCAKKIVVAAPAPAKPAKPAVKAAWQCTNLKATPKSNSDDSFTYTLRASASLTKARLVSADFDFGDGDTQAGLETSSTTSNTIAVDHTYAEAGDYTAKATLTFEANDGAEAEGDSTTATCEVAFTIKKPAQTTAVLSSSTTKSSTPELPNTGAAGVAGVVGGVSALGTLGYRLRASRRLAKVDDLVNKLRF